MARSGNNILLRPLTPDDLNRVVDIDAKLVGRRRPGFFEKRLAAALAEPEYFVYVGAEIDNELHGYLIVRILGGEYGETKSIAVLDVIGVEPDQQSHGIGSMMLESLKEILRHKGIAIVTTQSDWHNLSFLRFLASTGFKISPVYVLERKVDYINTKLISEPVKTDYETEGAEKDYSDSNGDDEESLARDLVFCRSLNKNDLLALVRIDKKVTGMDHTAYYERKIKEVLEESGIRVSLVAEIDGQIFGFIMARVDYGEFDRTEPAAVLDTIAVDPGFGHHHIGSALLSQLLANLTSLRLETIRTVVNPDHFDVLEFLVKNGFHTSQRLSLSYSVR